MTALSAARERQHYELAALRLLLDVLATIEQIPVLTPDLLDPVIITSIRRFTPTGLEPIEPE